MQSPCLREAKQFFLHSCCSTPILEALDSNNTHSPPGNTSATCRRSFTATTTTSLFPNSHFTNHECLPSPLQSRMTGANYSYQWMSMAQENGWHVLLDACALGPKDMDSFGLSLIRPDFLVCSFYKVFGENPTGFGCLFVRKSVITILEDSNVGGILELMPAKQLFLLPGDSSGTDTEHDQTSAGLVGEDEPDSIIPETRNSTNGETAKGSIKEALSDYASGKFTSTLHDKAD